MHFICFSFDFNLIMDECSIGRQLQEDCHKTTYNRSIEYTNEILSDDVRSLISKRMQVDKDILYDMCSFHKENSLCIIPKSREPAVIQKIDTVSLSKKEDYLKSPQSLLPITLHLI